MTGQDWIEKDFYKVLGVDKDADASAIKKAYRSLARKYHPDQNPGDAAAEAKFKDIGEAYSVLSDPEQRKQYDALRQMAGGGPRFTAGGGGTAGGAGFEDLFGGMFGGGGGRQGSTTFSAEDLGDLFGMFGGGGGGRFGGGNFGSGSGFGGGFRSAPQKGQDVAAHASLTFRQAAAGAELKLTVGGKSINVRVPAGVRDGQKLRLRGKGSPSPNGGENGDLVVTVTVTPHPLFTLDGANLRLTVPVTFAEAALGATIEVPTLDGPIVKLKVPAGTPSGRTLRAKGKGVKTAKKTGDLLVTIEVAVPRKVNSKAKDALKAFEEAMGEGNPREGLVEEAAR